MFFFCGGEGLTQGACLCLFGLLQQTSFINNRDLFLLVLEAADSEIQVPRGHSPGDLPSCWLADSGFSPRPRPAT